MDMRKDRGDSPSFAPWQLSSPSSRIKMVKDDLIHSLVYRVTLHQHLTKINASISL